MKKKSRKEGGRTEKEEKEKEKEKWLLDLRL